MNNAIVSGVFSDFKLVKTRGVAQLVIELPLERAANALEMFGVPQPGEEIHVAVARLHQEQPQPKPKRSFDDMSPAQQAGLLCNDKDFSRFIRTKKTDAEPVEFVRKYCGIGSRSELNVDLDAKEIWSDLVGDFRIWQRHGDIR